MCFDSLPVAQYPVTEITSLKALMDKDLLTPAKAAKLKGVSRTAIYSAIAERRLKHTRVLDRLAIRKADLLSWTPVRYAGRPKGIPMTAEAKSRLSASQRQRWARQKQQKAR